MSQTVVEAAESRSPAQQRELLIRYTGYVIVGLVALWAVYEPDRFPDMAAKPLPDRFAGCPWGCYYIEVAAGTGLVTLALAGEVTEWEGRAIQMLQPAGFGAPREA